MNTKTAAASKIPRFAHELDALTAEGYHKFYDVAPVGFFTLDRQGRISELNEKGAKMLGFPSMWLLGRAFVVFVASQDVQRFLQFLRSSIREAHTSVIELDMYVDTRTVPVQMSVTTSADNASIHHRLTVIDLTDIRKTEKLLQESLSSWNSLVQSAPDAILTVERNGRIHFLNKPLWGYSVRALMGMNLLDQIPNGEKSKLLKCLTRAFRFNKRSMCDINGIGGDRTRWYNFSVGAPHFEFEVTAARTTTTTVTIREVTEAKRTEDKLRASGKQMRDFAARIEAVREEERTRLAREIHDELGQALTALKMDLAWAETKARANDVRKKMKTMMAHVDETIERVRRISYELRPSILDDLGLIAAIEWQVAEFRKRTRIRTELVSKAENLRLSKDTAAAVFRVVQEALTNVMRHAKATKVKVTLEATPNAFNVSITDNGKGMTRNQETDFKSIGIVGMKERISRLRGEFNLLSEPGRGTRIEITIPVKND